MPPSDIVLSSLRDKADENFEMETEVGKAKVGSGIEVFGALRFNMNKILSALLLVTLVLSLY